MSITRESAADGLEASGASHQEAGLGLRERKRIATSRSIQYAVLELSRDKGLDHVTVDDISRRADISPRTFFNYFPSKESAVLGESPFSLPPDDVEAFVIAGPDAPIFDGLLGIMRTIADHDSHDLDMHRLRKLVIRDYPHLLVQRITTMHEFEIALTGVVERRLAADAQALALANETPDHPLVPGRARLITLVAVAAMRHAWTRWAESPDGQTMSSLLTRSFRELHTLI